MRDGLRQWSWFGGVRAVALAALLAGLCTLLPASQSMAQPAAEAARGLGPERPSGLLRPVAVFGSDDRGPVPLHYRLLQDRIGLLFNDRSRTVCTAFCVAESMIATAAHCLFKTSGETPPKLGDFFFARYNAPSRDYSFIAGYAAGAAPQHVLAGSTRLSVDPPINAASDWALVRLAKPACNRGVLPVRAMKTEEIVQQSKQRRLFQISYHRDYANWRQAYSKPCEAQKSFANADWQTVQKDFTETTNLILHACDTGGASSGSPLLLEAPSGPVVVGINVGTYVQSKVLIQQGQPTQSVASDAVANTGVAAVAFADQIAPFRDAPILATSSLVRDLQALLKDRRHYLGQIDGAFGPLLKAAIETYERQNGLPTLGLPTETLLLQLGAPSAFATPASPALPTRRYVPSADQPGVR